MALPPLKIVRMDGIVSSELDYPQDVDLVVVNPRGLLRHPLFVRSAVTRIMRARYPINDYEAQLCVVPSFQKSLRTIYSFWRVFYSPPLRTVVWRAPYFISPMEIALARSQKSRERHPLYWSESPKGFVRGTNYWSDGICIVHKEIVARWELPKHVISGDVDLIRALGETNFDRVRYLMMLDHPEFYAPAPVVEVISRNGSVAFFDSRYVDMLRSRWLFPGCLLNRVDDAPYLVFRRGRVIPTFGGHTVLALRPIPVTEERRRIWEALSDGFWELTHHSPIRD